MSTAIRVIAGCLPWVFGLLTMGFAVERWLWFRTLPRTASARFCGNCQLAAIGVPIELALLGLLVVAASVLKYPYRSHDFVYWCLAVFGILLTPFIWGVPLFTFSFLVLAARIVIALFKRFIYSQRT